MSAGLSSGIVGGAPAAVAVLGGAAAGSAAGAAMTRWPQGRTLRRPVRSHCDHCDRALEARDLIPVVSWLLLGGRCRGCDVPIDGRLPIIELASASLVLGVVVIHGPSLRTLLLSVGIVAVVTASAIDLEHRIVPDRLTRPLAVIGLAGLLLLPLPRSVLLAGLTWAVGVPLVLRLVAALADRLGRTRPVGVGDSKLLVGVLALVAPWPGAPAALLLWAVLLAGSVAVLGLATGRLGRASRLPFAPAIGAAYLLVTLAPGPSVTVLTSLGGPA